MVKLDRSNNKVSHQIISTLREQIISGKYKKDSKLPAERELAEEFGVSQPTVREAIRALDAMGLLDVRHGSGTYVSYNRMLIVATALQTLLQLDEVSLFQALEVRKVLGRYSVALAATVGTEAEITEMKLALQELENPETVTSISEMVGRMVRFQTSISAACHNPLLFTLESLLIALLLQVQMRALRHRGLDYWKSRSLRFQQDRKQIMDGIESRDEEKAVSAMNKYFAHQMEQFRYDPDLVNMSFSDDVVVNAVSEILASIRQEGNSRKQKPD